MAEAAEKATDWMRALTLSVGVHLILALLWVMAVVWGWISQRAVEFVEEVQEARAFLEMAPEVLDWVEQVKTEPESAGEERASFVDAGMAEESEVPVRDAQYFGERSTAAGSEEEVGEGPLNVPFQGGREREPGEGMVLQETRFAEGERQGLAGREMEDEGEPEISAEERIARARELAAELLETEDAVPVPTVEEAVEEGLNEFVAEAAEEEVELEEALRETAEREGEEEAFEREASRTKEEGGARLGGISSAAVEGTARGRYLAQVHQAIEPLWREDCERKRDYIVPGTLMVRFRVGRGGAVSGFVFESRSPGDSVQAGLTMRAVRKADLPAIPEELLQELKGEPLEVRLTFSF
ncbi:MAG: hypothetical protein AAGC74_06300 [Verrucomicrobiota bacterium]